MSKFIDNHITMPDIKDIVSTIKFKNEMHKYSGKVESRSMGLVEESFSYAVIYRNEISYTVGTL